MNERAHVSATACAISLDTRACQGLGSGGQLDHRGESPHGGLGGTTVRVRRHDHPEEG